MNTFNIFGMRRSGLHCIIYDILDHLENIEFINNTRLKFYPQDYANKMFLFEDQLFNINNNAYNIIIIRDVFDNIVSRLKKLSTFQGNNSYALRGKGRYSIDNIQMRMKFIDVYCNILQESLNITNNISNKIIINYDKYISDKKYRINILNQLGIYNIKNDFNTNKIPNEGCGKSFKENENRNDIIKQNKNNNSLNELLNSDEFNELIKKYYNYDLHLKFNQIF